MNRESSEQIKDGEAAAYNGLVADSMAKTKEDFGTRDYSKANAMLPKIEFTNDSIRDAARSAKDEAIVRDAVSRVEQTAKPASEMSAIELKRRIGTEPDTSKIEKFLDNLSKQYIRTEDGCVQLPTGDIVMRVNGEQTTVMPNNDHLIVGPNGETEYIPAPGNPAPKVSTDASGVVTLSFQNGDVVKYDNKGLLSVKRGDEEFRFSDGIENQEPSDPLKPFRPEASFEDQAKAVFSKVDSDADGKVSRAELEKAKVDPRLSAQEKEVVDAMLNQYDKLRKLSDDPGRGEGISPEDLNKLAESRKAVEEKEKTAQALNELAGDEQKFNALDKNGDDYISEDEISQALQNGNLSQTDREALELLQKQFEEVKSASRQWLAPKGISRQDVEAYQRDVAEDKSGQMVQDLDSAVGRYPTFTIPPHVGPVLPHPFGAKAPHITQTNTGTDVATPPDSSDVPILPTAMQMQVCG